jgi:hypothetical protein
MLAYLGSMTTGLRTPSLRCAQSESTALSVGETRGMQVIDPSVSPHSSERCAYNCGPRGKFERRVPEKPKQLPGLGLFVGRTHRSSTPTGAEPGGAWLCELGLRVSCAFHSLAHGISSPCHAPAAYMCACVALLQEFVETPYSKVAVCRV